MDRIEFVRLARTILDTFGEPYLRGAKFEDNRMIIRSNYNGLDLEITRKPMPDVASFLDGSNPTTMVKGSEIIRHHGEAAYLHEHITEVATRAAKADIE